MPGSITVRKTQAAWTAKNPILADGQYGFEDETGRFKLGDGTTHWNALSYTDGVPFVVPYDESETSSGFTGAGLATESTLASKASEGTLASRASEAQLATRASEANLDAVRLLTGTGVDKGGVSRRVLVDTKGRTKISHAQPDLVSADLIVIGDAFVIDMDSMSDVQFLMRGAAHAGYNLSFEYSVDTTAAAGYVAAASPSDGNWFPMLGKSLVSSAAAPASTTGVLTSNSSSSYECSVPGALRARVRVTARTSGTLTVAAVPTTAGRPVSVGAVVSSGTVTISSGTVTANLGTGGTGATALGKAEDAAAASGDTGVAVFGVRAPATPVAQTSAAGDYGAMAIDSEGKQIVLAGADPAQTFQSVTTLTVATVVAARAAQAAGIRSYVTDLTVSNTSATATRVDVLDGATVIWSAGLNAGQTVDKSFRTPLRGTAATAMNVQSSVAVTDVRVSMSGYSGV